MCSGTSRQVMPSQFYPGHLLVDAHLVIAGVTLLIALLHLHLSYRGIRRDVNLPFAAASFFVAGEAFTGPGRFLSPTVPDMIFWWKLSWVFILPLAAALMWFARGFTRTRERKVPILLTVALSIALALEVGLPYGLRFHTMPCAGSSPLTVGRDDSMCSWESRIPPFSRSMWRSFVRWPISQQLASGCGAHGKREGTHGS